MLRTEICPCEIQECVSTLKYSLPIGVQQPVRPLLLEQIAYMLFLDFQYIFLKILKTAFRDTRNMIPESFLGATTPNRPRLLLLT